MSVNLNGFGKLGVVLFASLIVISCGGGSGSGDGSGSGGDSGSGGNCVTIPQGKVGFKTVVRADGEGGTFGTFTSYAESVITAINNNSMSYKNTIKISIDGEDKSYTEVSQEFTIVNNYTHLTKQMEKTSQAIPNAPVTVLTTEYFPYKVNRPVGEVCEGQTWTSDYDVTQTVKTPGFPQNTSTGHESSIGTVIGVNVEKIVPAGKFNTAHIQIEDGTNTITYWVDTELGMAVATEVIQGDINFSSNTKLISFSE